MINKKILINCLFLILGCTKTQTGFDALTASSSKVAEYQQPDLPRCGYIAIPEIEVTYWLIENRVVYESYECPKCHRHFKLKNEATNCYVTDIFPPKTSKKSH